MPIPLHIATFRFPLHHLRPFLRRKTSNDPNVNKNSLTSVERFGRKIDYLWYLRMQLLVSPPNCDPMNRLKKQFLHPQKINWCFSILESHIVKLIEYKFDGFI